MKANPLTDDVKITVRKPEREAGLAATHGSDDAIKTPREILSQLQQLSRTCDTPEDGVLKALKIIGGVQNASRRSALKEAAKIIEDKCSWTEGEQRFFGGISVLEAHTEILVRVAAHQND
jgi:hypothetical protein